MSIYSEPVLSDMSSLHAFLDTHKLGQELQNFTAKIMEISILNTYVYEFENKPTIHVYISLIFHPADKALNNCKNY